jgi:uncharacterized protein YjlB
MEPETFQLDDDGVIPNNPRLPVLLWRGVLPANDPAAAEALFARNGWPPAWRNGIYRHHHYHPNAHEALAIARGSVRVQLGGEQGAVLELKAGDAVALPAGTGHKNLGQSPDLLVVGAYPAGQRPDQVDGQPEAYAAALPRIAATPDPKGDPVSGLAWPQHRQG